MSFAETQVAKPLLKDTDNVCAEIANGDRKAFEKAYRDHLPSLLRYAGHLTQDSSIIEDSIQDVFVALWSGRSNLHSVHSLKAYLLVSLRNTICRKSAAQTRSLMRCEEWRKDTSILDSLTGGEEIRVARVRAAINDLTNSQREVIFLRFYEGLSFSEIAQTLSIDRQHAYNLVSKAYSCLRELIRHA